MSNHWTDIQNAKVVLVGGGNPAENHPLGFRHVEKAIQNGAQLVVVDPRFTRTAALAQHYLQIRPGTDLVWLGAVIRHVLAEGLFDHDFVFHHTNARMRIHEGFGFADGLFSGYQAPPEGETPGRYDTETWGYQLEADGTPRLGDTLEDADTVFSHLRAHFDRYTFELAERVTGMPAAKMREVAELFGRTRPGTILYALGMTQHTTGSQAIRCYAILQLLLGNVGRPGGGLNACRGESNVQGSSDLAALPHILPGYLPMPRPGQDTLDDYGGAYGSLARKRLAALCAAWWGSPEGYRFLPRIDRSPAEYSWTDTFQRMADGGFDLYLCLAENPAVSAANATLVGEALARLKTLVVIDLFETETASFWKAPGVDPTSIDTEVFLLPGAYGAEKQGSITNSGRWIQWGEKAIDPPGDARSDAEIIDGLFQALRRLGETDAHDDLASIRAATWDYANDGHVVDEERVLQEINGRDLETGALLTGSGQVTALPEGRVAAGQWLYAGVYGEGENRTKRRTAGDDPAGPHPAWAWSWPDNIRILYNRANANLDGTPKDPERPYVWWDAEAGRWTGVDVPDVPDVTAGPDTPAGRVVFKRLAEKVGRLFVGPYRAPDGTVVDKVLSDGPLPEHYEPVESPSDNLLHPDQAVNPLARLARATIGSRADYPYVLTTHDVVEHWLSGTVTTRIPQLREAIPGPFVEISRQLGDSLGVRGGEAVTVETARGKARLPAVVTGRIPPLTVDGRTIEVVSVHWAWGWSRPAVGDVANLLTMDVVEPNAGAPEFKSALCRVTK